MVNEYIKLANAFTQDLSTELVTPIGLIFASLVGLWYHGIKMIVGKGDLLGFGHEFIYVVIAGLLVAGQGPKLVNEVYSVALSTMGGAASMVLSAGEISNKTKISSAGAKDGGRPCEACGSARTRAVHV